jgi:hypothetical protein
VRVLPSPVITRLLRYYDPLRFPAWPPAHLAVGDPTSIPAGPPTLPEIPFLRGVPITVNRAGPLGGLLGANQPLVIDLNTKLAFAVPLKHFQMISGQVQVKNRCGRLQFVAVESGAVVFSHFLVSAFMEPKKGIFPSL